MSTPFVGRLCALLVFALLEFTCALQAFSLAFALLEFTCALLEFEPLALLAFAFPQLVFALLEFTYALQVFNLAFALLEFTFALLEFTFAVAHLVLFFSRAHRQ